MEIFSALLTKVFVWAGSFIHDAYASAVLPHLADVTLNKETAELIGLSLQISQGHARLDSVGWRAWVILIATNASGDFIFFGYFIVKLVVKLRGLVAVNVVLARSSACQGRLGLCIVKWLFGLFRGKRVRGG